MTNPNQPTFPIDPLETASAGLDDDLRRRHIQGILESYNGNYDTLTEIIQNSVDALEDASLSGLPGPFRIEVTINLKENWIGVLDTGIGMSTAELVKVCAPHASLKPNPALASKRDKRSAYRGYKGVGLTFLAYGTDDFVMHSKNATEFTKARMQYGRAWVDGRRSDAAMLTEDTSASPLDTLQRGTYIRIQLSQFTRPKSLVHLASTIAAWDAILRTKTAVGQVLLERQPVVSLDVELKLIADTGTETRKVEPEFLYPHTIKRPHPFRFLNVPKYYESHSENSEPPDDKKRQDGIFLVWDSQKINAELTGEQKATYSDEMKDYTPTVYAFLPYQGAVWGELNNLTSGKRLFLKPGLTIAVNRQRLLEQDEINATRFETFSRNVFVLVHFDNAKPDFGRKTLQTEVQDLAQRIADRAVQYLAKQRAFLRASGEAPTAEAREIESGHDDWQFNVRSHAKTSPLHIPPINYASTPLVEQDVIGLFHQLAAVEQFPGLKVFATSQNMTYDCLIQFDCASDHPRLIYDGLSGTNPLGISKFVLGTKPNFKTAMLTLEFKNNLDALIDDVAPESKKKFNHIDICVCWGVIGSSFKGYELIEVTDSNVDQRAFPGITHLLKKDGDAHVMQIILLRSLVGLIQSGRIIVS